MACLSATAAAAAVHVSLARRADRVGLGHCGCPIACFGVGAAAGGSLTVAAASDRVNEVAKIGTRHIEGRGGRAAAAPLWILTNRKIGFLARSKLGRKERFNYHASVAKVNALPPCRGVPRARRPSSSWVKDSVSERCTCAAAALYWGSQIPFCNQHVSHFLYIYIIEYNLGHMFCCLGRVRIHTPYSTVCSSQSVISVWRLLFWKLLPEYIYYQC